MGSTLETAIIFTVVITVITMFILFPLDLCGDAFHAYNEGNDLLCDNYTDNLSSQDINYMFTGLSENYRLIYSALTGTEDA